MSDSNEEVDPSPRGDAARVSNDATPGASEPAPLLSYDTSAFHPGMVTIARVTDLAEAEMVAGELEAEGVHSVVSNTLAAAMGPWGGGAKVYVDVPKDQAERARQVLLVRTLGDEVEPAPAADDPPDAATAALPVVAAFAAASRMRDAVTLLGSAHIRCYTPRLVPRGDRPPGEGDRFTVRVSESDLERAREVLAEADADDEDDERGARDAADDEEPRCPKCSSWRVHRTESMWVNIGRFFGLAGGSAATDPFVCLACGHEWPPRVRG